MYPSRSLGNSVEEKGTRKVTYILWFLYSWSVLVSEKSEHCSRRWPACLPHKTQGKTKQAFPFQSPAYKTT